MESDGSGSRGRGIGRGRPFMLSRSGSRGGYRNPPRIFSSALDSDSDSSSVYMSVESRSPSITSESSSMNIRSSFVSSFSSSSGQGGHGSDRVKILDQKVAPEPATEDGPKIQEADEKALSLMHDLRINGKNKSERFIMCQLWSHPVGATRPIMLITMNELVDSDNVFIPGEIALTPFTVKKGLNLNKIFWTLVDPATHIPTGYRIESFNNAREFGLPNPSDFYDGNKHQNYHEIVEKMESFIKENSKPSFLVDDGNEGGTYFVFCEKKCVPRYAIGLDWLYSKGGKGKFPHKIIPLETVLVVLSLGGLEKVANRSSGSVEQSFAAITNAFNKVVHEVTTTRSEFTSRSRVMENTVSRLLTRFTGPVANTHTSMYSSLNGVTERLASTRFIEHPYAFLGAFMFEDQASRYLEHMDYVWKKHLACEYHRDEGTEEDAGKGKKRVMKMKMITAKSPSHKMMKCAKTNGARMVFLALDVMLVNYGYKPNEGRHFPLAED